VSTIALDGPLKARAAAAVGAGEEKHHDEQQKQHKRAHERTAGYGKHDEYEDQE